METGNLCDGKLFFLWNAKKFDETELPTGVCNWLPGVLSWLLSIYFLWIDCNRLSLGLGEQIRRFYKKLYRRWFAAKSEPLASSKLTSILGSFLAFCNLSMLRLKYYDSLLLLVSSIDCLWVSICLLLLTSWDLSDPGLETLLSPNILFVALLETTFVLIIVKMAFSFWGDYVAWELSGCYPILFLLILPVFLAFDALTKFEEVVSLEQVDDYCWTIRNCLAIICLKSSGLLAFAYSFIILIICSWSVMPSALMCSCCCCKNSS